MPDADNNFVEHRKFLRLNAQMAGYPTCKMPLESDKTIELQLTDISPGGFGTALPEYLGKHFHKGREFSCCQISIAGMNEVSVRVVDILRLRTKTGETSLRACFEFTTGINWMDTALASCE